MVNNKVQQYMIVMVNAKCTLEYIITISKLYT